MLRTDNQPVNARHGDMAWITDFITPRNPSVQLQYQALTSGLESFRDRVRALWGYVSSIPYKETIASQLWAGSHNFVQKDTWFYPAEEMVVGKGNCANKAFLMTSLLKNELPGPGQVFCVIGNLVLDRVGAHAWVEANIGGVQAVIETTTRRGDHAFVLKECAEAYQPMVYFDDQTVYKADGGVDVGMAVSMKFGLYPIPFLEEYLCRECLALEGV